MDVSRPSKQEYFLLIALAARSRADCLGRKVGAVIIREDRVISTGYNGTPFGTANCSEGGCHRCANKEMYAPGAGYDLCVCVHAEQNAILTAARFGQSTLGASVTSTLQPCFSCMKECLQAGIKQIRFLQPWNPADSKPELVAQYEKLQNQFQVFEAVQSDSLEYYINTLKP